MTTVHTITVTFKTDREFTPASLGRMAERMMGEVPEGLNAHAVALADLTDVARVSREDGWLEPV